MKCPSGCASAHCLSSGLQFPTTTPDGCDQWLGGRPHPQQAEAGNHMGPLTEHRSTLLSYDGTKATFLWACGTELVPNYRDIFSPASQRACEWGMGSR